MASKPTPELDRIRRLRADADLGLHMAERLAHAGETGSAVRLLEEVRQDVVTGLTVDATPSTHRSRPPRWRRSVVVGSVAAVLGMASAAAVMAPESTPASDPTARPAPPAASVVDQDSAPLEPQADEWAQQLIAPEAPTSVDSDATRGSTPAEPDGELEGPLAPDADLPEPGDLVPPSLPETVVSPPDATEAP